MEVCHHCDNPPCVKTEPDAKYPSGHLFVGTHTDNMRDAMRKGRLRPVRGEKAVQSKLTDDDIRAIRAKHRAGATYKQLGIEYGVVFSNIRWIVIRRTWRHVQ